MNENPYQSPITSSPAAAAVYTKPTMKELITSFEGRVPRRVYWGVSLASAAIFYGISIPLTFINETLGGIAMLLLLIPLIWVNLAINVKRWHDRNKSGVWILIGFVPLIGGVWALIECGCLRGTIGDNQFGADPT